MKGFTLVEAMVAVSILAISVAAPTYGASRALTATQNASNQLTASYLAQEGVEYVRLLRDTYYLEQHATARDTASDLSWDALTSNVVNVCGGTGCYLDLTDLTLASCSSEGCPKLYVNKATGAYSTEPQSGYEETIYTRSITATPVALGGGDDEVMIVSTVSWLFHGTPYKVEIVSRVTRWLP